MIRFNHAVAAVAALFMISGGAAVEWDDEEIKTYSNQSELEALASGNPNVVVTNANSSNGYYITTNASSNKATGVSMAWQNTEMVNGQPLATTPEVDGWKFVTGFPEPAAQSMKAQITYGSVENGEMDVAQLIDGQRTVWQDNLSNPYILASIGMEKTEGMPKEVSPRIYSLTAMNRDYPAVQSKKDVSLEENESVSVVASVDEFRDVFIERNSSNSTLEIDFTAYNDTAEVRSDKIPDYNPEAAAGSLDLYGFMSAAVNASEREFFEGDASEINASTLEISVTALNGSATLEELSIIGVSSQEPVSAAAPVGTSLWDVTIDDVPIVSDVVNALSQAYNGLVDTIMEVFN